ncbi:MAG: type IV secretion system DNA-binding domain-containing protein [Candidatus Gracilibacteria bacterium]|nr:type IV secretion system DNA-binding domain-containing protein [Candidatus Gracilibacteria bacterium]
MKKTYLIKVFHSYSNGKQYIKEFFKDINKTLKDKKFTLGINSSGGEIFYSVTTSEYIYPVFETHFYSYFNDFQIVPDYKGVWEYDLDRTIVGELSLDNNRFYPFNHSTSDNTEFIFNLFRSFENLGILEDKIGLFIDLKPILGNSFSFFIKSNILYKIFKIKLFFQFFRYIFNHKITKGWKKIGDKYFKNKLGQDLFETKIYIVIQGETKSNAIGKLSSFFNNFTVFRNYPLNEFNLKIHKVFDLNKISKYSDFLLSAEELPSIFHFPSIPKNELSLLKVTSKKLSLPIGVPIFKYKVAENGERYAVDYPERANIIGISDYRSTRLPIGIYDEDRTKHMYVIGKTGTGKSRFLTSMMITDINQGKGIGVIDPHGDLIDDIMSHIPESRIKDVIIFDPSDVNFPFCFNPLETNENESKQVLIKGFTDVFKKMFGSNRNFRMEHMLRMILLALLDKPNSTLFDIVKILTDKDYKDEVLNYVNDNVVKNFWINEYPNLSPMFVSEAVFPILNKVSQLLSIESLKNIFSSHENKLDFRKMMDEGKILLVKLPKGKYNQEIIGFLGAMFVTKIFQAAMGRQGLTKHERKRFFLYADEFQNFTTDTFCEILSEARKYGLGLILAHQFIKQIPPNITDAIFGNVSSLVIFRVSSEDAQFLSKYFDPFLSNYDFSHLNKREFYCKLLVEGQVKDPLSMKSVYVPDRKLNESHLNEIYNLSRTNYSRNLQEAQDEIITEYKDVIDKVCDLVNR